MPANIQVGDRVLVPHLPGIPCQNPDCLGDPVVGTVVSGHATPLGASFFVRLPCGAEALYTDGLVESA